MASSESTVVSTSSILSKSTRLKMGSRNAVRNKRVWTISDGMDPIHHITAFAIPSNTVIFSAARSVTFIVKFLLLKFTVYAHPEKCKIIAGRIGTVHFPQHYIHFGYGFPVILLTGNQFKLPAHITCVNIKRYR